MSSPSPKVAAPHKPVFSSVEPLSDGAAKWYTHVHAALIPTVFYIRFNDLVADPVSTLLTSIVPISLIQITYAVICLPVAGSSLNAANPTKAPKAGQRKKGSQRGFSAIGGKIMTAILSLILSLLLGTLILMVIMILMGAPITTHLEHTALCAAHMALLAGLPLVYVHGVDTSKWRAVSAALLPIDEVFGASIGVLLGAWFGAVPISLDWDREWQKWPVTIITGAYIGYLVGKLAGAYLLKGKTIKFD